LACISAAGTPRRLAGARDGLAGAT